MNTVSPVSLKGLLHSQYIEWHKKLQIKLKEMAKKNLNKRYQQIEIIVNHVISSSIKTGVNQNNSFKLSDNDITKMIKNIQNEIDEWKGIKHKLCKKQKTTYKQYYSTSRNWFNRNKYKFYGNYFYFPLIFHFILKHCIGLKGSTSNSISNNNKMYIFMQILNELLSTNIPFSNSKPQPLILQQTLIQINLFNTAFKELMTHYLLSWNMQNNSFKKGLHQIKSLLNSNKKQYKLPSVCFDNVAVNGNYKPAAQRSREQKESLPVVMHPVNMPMNVCPVHGIRRYSGIHYQSNTASQQRYTPIYIASQNGQLVPVLYNNSNNNNDTRRPQIQYNIKIINRTIYNLYT